MKKSNSRRFFGFAIVMMSFVLSSCGNGDKHIIKEKSIVISNNNADKGKMNTNKERDLLDTIYEKLSESDKKMIIDLSEANINKVVLKSDKGVKKVSESVDIIGNEIYKAEYRINNETLGELIVYADIDNLSILGYGLIE